VLILMWSKYRSKFLIYKVSSGNFSVVVAVEIFECSGPCDILACLPKSLITCGLGYYALKLYKSHFDEKC
jgi:hypothetical protein